MIKMKITGLSELTKRLDTLKRAAADLDGSIASVSLEAGDPASIDCAMRELDAAVDRKLGSSQSDPVVAQLADAVRERGRAHILAKAEEARLAGKAG